MHSLFSASRIGQRNQLYELPNMLFHDILHNIHSFTICTYLKGKKRLLHVDDISKPPFFLYYMYKCGGTSTDDFSVKEATFNLKLAECMQKTCSNLNPRLHKNWLYALICNFYWRLSHKYTRAYIRMQEPCW